VKQSIEKRREEKRVEEKRREYAHGDERTWLNGINDIQ
jgi:hypothetical protein